MIEGLIHIMQPLVQMFDLYDDNQDSSEKQDVLIYAVIL